MPEKQTFEIPQQLREIAEKNIEQARTAYGQLMDARSIRAVEAFVRDPFSYRWIAPQGCQVGKARSDGAGAPPCWSKLPPACHREDDRVMLRGLVILTTLASAFTLGLSSAEAFAAEKDLTNKGEALVQENCSRCHAIGKEGNSTHPEAPPFRTLSSRYPIEDLSESLAEGIVSGHPDMPIFVFSPSDIEAIIDYLQSIQEQPSSAPKP
jgi:cytochrome c